MSTYFKNFPSTPYSFGVNLPQVAYTNITAYVDVIDQVKDNISFYRSYYIQEGDRPDQLSHKIYGSADYYWTFFLLNDHLKEQGWPLTYDALSKLVDKKHPNTVVETKDIFANRFKVGQTVTGSSSGVSGRIMHRNLDLGQIFIENSEIQVSDAGESTFRGNEVLTSQVGENIESLTLIKSSSERDSVRYYVDGDNLHCDIDPHGDSPADKTPITQLEYYIAENDKLKAIKVIKPDTIRDVFREFQDQFING